MPRIEIVTVDARPTYAQLEKWFAQKTNVILHERGMLFGKPFDNKTEGTIRYLRQFDGDDGIVMQEGHSAGMYIRDIVSYTESKIIYSPPEAKVVLSKKEALAYPAESTLLLCGSFSVYVSKILLTEYSEYFKARFNTPLKENTSDSIDLTDVISPKGLQLLLSLLQKTKDKERTCWPYLSLDELLEMIVASDYFLSPQLLNRAFEEIASSMRSDENIYQLNKLLLSIPKEIHPLIRNLIENVKEWKKRYLRRFPTYVLDEHQVITTMPRALLHTSLSDYELEMLRYAMKLSDLTNSYWIFNGFELCSPRIYTHHPDNPKHKNIYTNAVITLLIKRGIISGRKCKHDDRNPFMREKWACQVANKTALFAINDKELRSEIEEASQLIQDITGYPCVHLHIHQIPYNILLGRVVEPLAQVGCIDVERYFAFDVYVVDFNIKLLRLLKDESITLKMLTKRYLLADKSMPVFDQIISPKRQAFHLESMELSKVDYPPKEWDSKKSLGLCLFLSNSSSTISQQKFDRQSRILSEPRAMLLWSKVGDKNRAVDDSFVEQHCKSAFRHREI